MHKFFKTFGQSVMRFGLSDNNICILSGYKQWAYGWERSIVIINTSAKQNEPIFPCMCSSNSRCSSIKSQKATFSRVHSFWSNKTITLTIQKKSTNASKKIAFYPKITIPSLRFYFLVTMLSDPRVVSLCHALAATHHRWTLWCSWGPDSFALLHRLITLIAQENLPVTLLVVSCHHGRASADHELASVAQRCHDQHLARYAHYRDPWLSQDERWLRLRRHQCFLQTMNEQWSSLLVLGHHQDDQCETMLLNLMRGCKLAWLTALPLLDRHFLDPSVTVVRPCIFFSKEQLRTYCDHHWLPYHHDPTNTDTTVSQRNRVRHSMTTTLKASLVTLRQDLDTMYDLITQPRSPLTQWTHPFGKDVLLWQTPIADQLYTIDELVRVMRRCGSYHNVSQTMLHTLAANLARLGVGKRMHQGNLFWLRMHDHRWIVRASTPCWLYPPQLDHDNRQRIAPLFLSLPSVWWWRQRWTQSSCIIQGKKYHLTDYARSHGIPRPLRKRCLLVDDTIIFPTLCPMASINTLS